MFNVSRNPNRAIFYGRDNRLYRIVRKKVPSEFYEIDGRTIYDEFNVLQQKTFFGWKEVDKEQIPEHALISLGCFGDAGWRSPMHEKYGF